MDARASRTASQRMYGDSEGRYVEVFLDHYLLPDGGSVDLHRVRVGGGRTGVVVLARSGGRVVLVRQWRPAIERWMWELPRGFGESGPEEDALRELEEETGLKGTRPRTMAWLNVDSGLLQSEVAVVEVQVAPHREPSADGGDEVASARWWDWAELRAAVRAGEIRDAFTLAALGAAESQ